MEKKTERTPRVKQSDGIRSTRRGWWGIFPFYGGGLSMINWRTTTTTYTQNKMK
jgi:hypothetical protein